MSDSQSWQVRCWGDMATLAYGRAPTQYGATKADGNVPLYGTNGQFGYTPSALAMGPTVIVGRKGAYRGVHYVRGPFWVVDTGFYLVPSRPLDPRWAYYELLTHDINAMDSGSAIPSTSREDFYAMPVRVPPLPEQVQIGAALGVLDDKIELNRRLVGTIRAMAHHELRLGADETSPLRLGDLGDIQKGLSYKGSGLLANQNSIPMVNLANFGRQGWLDRGSLKPYSGAHQSRHLVRGWDVVVANTDLTQQRLILGRPGLIPEDVPSAIFSHHVYAVRLRDPDLAVAVWAALNTHEFRVRAEGYATGTTVAGLPRDALEEFEFSVASGEVRKMARALIRRAWRAEIESATLASVRDTLLPELISGRLPAREFESHEVAL